jgi:hypothetical protein
VPIDVLPAVEAWLENAAKSSARGAGSTVDLRDLLLC